MLVRFPGLLFALTLAFGIWLRSLGSSLVLVAGAAFAACTATIVWRGWRRTRQAGVNREAWRSALAGITYAALGYIRAPSPDRALGDPLGLDEGVAGMATRVRGVVDLPPVALPGLPGRDEGVTTSFSIVPDDGSPGIAVRCAGRPEIAGGDNVEAIGRLRLRTGPKNPGDLGAPRVRLLSVSDPLAVRRLPRIGWPTLTALIGALRERSTRVLERLYGEEMRGFIVAMVLGDRRWLTSDIRDALLLTGTFHLLAISGMHVTLLMFGLYRIPLPPRAGGPIRLLLLLVFTLVTGASPPVLRAAVMFIFHSIAESRRRRARPLNTLGWSAVLLLGIDPGLVSDVGFQLSFVSVASILTWGARLGSLAKGLPKACRPWARSFLVSFGASAGTAPLILFYFQRFHPLGPLWNLLAFPLTVVPLGGGILSLLLGLVNPALGAPVAWAVDRGSRALLLPLQLGARAPGSSVFLPPPPGWTVALAYACLAIWLLVRVRRALFLWICFAALGAGACAILLTPRPPEIWTFDAGPGDASLIRAPGAGSILIDAGMSGFADQAGISLTRVVLAVGSRSVPLVFLTHPHADHTRGLEGLAARLDVGQIWAPPGFEGSETGRQVAAWATARGSKIEPAARGLTFQLGPAAPAPGLEIEILYPPRSGPGEAAGAVNDVSLALRISRRGDRFLFLGDLEEEGIAALLCAERDLEAQTMLAPHHGRQNKLWSAMLERIRPQNVVISGTGEGGGRELADRLERSGVRVWATWRRGAVRTIWTEGAGWVSRYWRE